MIPNILHIFERLSKIYLEPCMGIIRYIFIHYYHFPLFCLFSIIRFIHSGFRYISWSRNGIIKKVNRIRYGLDYEESAQILNIHWTCTVLAHDTGRSYNFLTTHHSFVHPKFVLDNEKCILAELTVDYAMFFELEKSLSEYSASTVPFLWATLPFLSARLIIMPSMSIKRLSIEMGAPENEGANLTFLWNSGRSGSTLTAKIVDKADPETLVLSEPSAILFLFKYKRQLCPLQYERLSESTMRILTKPMSGKRKYFIKPPFYTINIADDIHKVFPKAGMLYLYRKPLRTVLSHERAFGWTVFYMIIQLVFLTDQWEWGQRLLHFHRCQFIVENTSRFTLGRTAFDLCCLIWADNYIRYQKLAKQFKFPAIIYDRLFDNPQQFCAEILSFSNVHSSRVQFGMEAIFDGDSQEGSLFSQSTLKGLTATQFTPELKMRTDRFCDWLNIPRLENESRQNHSFSTLAWSSLKDTDDWNRENLKPFITSADEMRFEIIHAGNSAGPSSVNKSQIGNQKKPQFKPYYKPMPMQMIISQD